VVAPVLFAVFEGLAGLRAEIAHPGREHRLPPIGRRQSRKSARLCFFDESDQHARHPARWRVVGTNPDRTAIADGPIASASILPNMRFFGSWRPPAATGGAPGTRQSCSTDRYARECLNKGLARGQGAQKFLSQRKSRLDRAVLAILGCVCAVLLK